MTTRDKERMAALRNVLLRKAQFAAAMRGNVPMLIWLGKQWLGQKETARDEVTNAEPVQVRADLSRLSVEELAQLEVLTHKVEAA